VTPTAPAKSRKHSAQARASPTTETTARPTALATRTRSYKTGGVGPPTTRPGEVALHKTSLTDPGTRGRDHLTEGEDPLGTIMTGGLPLSLTTMVHQETTHREDLLWTKEGPLWTKEELLWIREGLLSTREGLLWTKEGHLWEEEDHQWTTEVLIWTTGDLQWI